MQQEVQFTLNGEAVTCIVDVRKSLLEMLREDFALIGPKEGCDVGECGACSVLINGQAIDSCIYLAAWVDGKTVTTIEGITNADGSLADIQQAFVDAGAVQCGFCIPGMIISSQQFLKENPHPSRTEVRRALSGNMCRCTGYQKIIEAVELAASEK